MTGSSGQGGIREKTRNLTENASRRGVVTYRYTKLGIIEVLLKFVDATPVCPRTRTAWSPCPTCHATTPHLARLPRCRCRRDTPSGGRSAPTGFFESLNPQNRKKIRTCRTRPSCVGRSAPAVHTRRYRPRWVHLGGGSGPDPPTGSSHLYFRVCSSSAPFVQFCAGVPLHLCAPPLRPCTCDGVLQGPCDFVLPDRCCNVNLSISGCKL